MTTQRIIKKYPNRRLYDTKISKYITIEDIRELVINNETFIVKDVKTDEDLTRNLLLQIIIEQENDCGEPIFSTQALSHIIRFYGDSLQTVMGDYLQQSIDLFVDNQKKFQSAISSNPINTMADITEQNLKTWKKIQENFFKST